MNRRAIGALVLLCLSLTLIFGSACNRAALSGSSPTATMKAFYEATQKKDPEGFKKTLSKGSLDLIETAAKAQGKTLDDMLKSGLNSPATAASSATPEMRNEKIDGDTATLEVMNDTNKEWEPIPFVKENGDWKIALDKAMRDAQQKAMQQRNVQ